MYLSDKQGLCLMLTGGQEDISVRLRRVIIIVISVARCGVSFSLGVL